MAGDISDEIAALAHGDLLSFRIALFPYSLLASRVWEMRANLTAYDGCYVALAELLGAELATLDLRLRRAPGVRGPFTTGPA